MAATAASMRPEAVRPSRAARAEREAHEARRVGGARGVRTAPRRPAAAPTLRAVPDDAPGRTRGAAVGLIMTISVFVAILAIVVALQTLIAEQQLELDRTLTDVRLAQQHHVELRRMRAELRAPTHLIAQARLLGMMNGLPGKFQEISPEAVARVTAATANMDPLFLLPRPDPAVAPGAWGTTGMIAVQVSP
jgi:hypothetical protein